MVKRKNYTCQRCGHTHENVWIEVKHRDHLYCPKCLKNPEITKTEAKM